jgi:hypothetical protein
MARQVCFNLKRPTPHMGSGVDFRGFYPKFMRWVWLELTKQQPFGTTLNHMIHR